MSAGPARVAIGFIDVDCVNLAIIRLVLASGFSSCCCLTESRFPGNQEPSAKTVSKEIGGFIGTLYLHAQELLPRVNQGFVARPPHLYAWHQSLAECDSPRGCDELRYVVRTDMRPRCVGGHVPLRARTQRRLPVPYQDVIEVVSSSANTDDAGPRC